MGYHQAISAIERRPVPLEDGLLERPLALELLEHLRYEMELRGLRLDMTRAIREILRSPVGSSLPARVPLACGGNGVDDISGRPADPAERAGD